MKKLSFHKLCASNLPLFLLFLCAVLLSCTTVFSVSAHLLDSDASGDLVLAHHLYQTGGLLSEDWFYATEISAVYTQLFFTPLFSIFSSWQIVRFVGTLLMHLVYLLCCGFFMYQAGSSRKAFYLSAAMLLLPVSVVYGRVVLYHVYYIIHLSLSFLIVGSFLACTKALAAHKKVHFSLWFMLFVCISLISGLNGYRQIAITHAPLALLVIVWFYQAGTGEKMLLPLKTLFVLGAGVVATGIGLIVNMGWQASYSFRDFSVMGLSVIPAENLVNMLFGLFHQFGYRREIPLLTKMGLMSVASLAVALYCILHSVRAVLKPQAVSNIESFFSEYMLACSLVVVTLIFLFTRQNTFSELYFLPYCIWFVPMLSNLAAGPRASHPAAVQLPARRLVAWLFCAVCLVNGLLNLQSFNNVEGFNQRYEGLKNMTDPNYSSYLAETVDYLKTNEYDLGYAEYWDTNLVTELTDGSVRMIGIKDVSSSREEFPFVNYDWLSVRSYRTDPNIEKPFLLLHHYQTDRVEQTSLQSLVRPVFRSAGYVVYDILDLDAWRAAMLASE